METTSESGYRASLPTLSPTAHALPDAEYPGASPADLLGHFYPDSLAFDSKDVSLDWLNEVFSTTQNFPSSLVAQIPGDNTVSESEDSPVEPLSCQNPEDSCISLATGLLETMHTRSPSCLLDTGNRDSQPHPSRAVDDVLSANQLALKSLRIFLGCPCYTSHQLQLLITAVCAEIITWYWRIIQTYSHHRNTNMDDGILPADRIETTRRSFSVGDHCLEGHLETTLIGHVLSSRLHELEDFIEDLNWSRRQSGTPNTDSKHCPMLSGVHMRLDGFLTGQLSAVRRDLLNLLDDTSTDGAVLC